MILYSYHMKTFDKVATSHYVRASQMYHTNLIRVPALIFCSKKDPIGAERSNQRARENWENNGMKVFLLYVYHSENSI